MKVHLFRAVLAETAMVCFVAQGPSEPVRSGICDFISVSRTKTHRHQSGTGGQKDEVILFDRHGS